MRKKQDNISRGKNNNNNNNGFIPNSLKFISSCVKTVSSNVRSAGDHHHKDQVLWACFDRLHLNPSTIKPVLLLGYFNGFQILDVEDSSNVNELVSRHDDPVTFLQMQPIPSESKGCERFRSSHPLLLVVASDEGRGPGPIQNGRDNSLRNGYIESQRGNLIHSPTAVRFYSLRSHSYVHVLRFRSTVYMVRCSPRIVAVGLAAQIYCFDALTLENKFSVLTYPVPQLGGQGVVGINIGYGPMAVGPRWLAYASNNPLNSNTGRLSPQCLSPSPGVSPSTSPGSGSLVARYAMESSKQLAAGLINLGDMGYKTLSKYCHELRPDGSSSPPGSSNTVWKVGRVATHSTETDTAGMVVIKDFVSRAVVSQFRAHTSPISALCFDPSGTLLVTASIHGNNINIFRIMPTCSENGSDTCNYDWSSSHFHLYKLHRGITSAVIQDICFSHYSQWIAIVSSRGTCHIFVLSPFGGETGLQLQNSHINGPTLLPVLSVPWWSTSSFTINQSFSPQPPAPITLSVVSRIKNVNSGWLNAVSNAASSATGMISAELGIGAAIFHRSLHHTLGSALVNVNSLEHLLVYTPAGNVIQYELLPSVGGEQSESPLRSGPGSVMQMQEEELRVKVETVQWWDVCRRADWPEREFIYDITLGQEGASEAVMDTSDHGDNDIGEKGLLKPHEQSHWLLSNAEVQMRSGRIPVWQKSKIYIYTMSPATYEEQNNYSTEYTGGEIEIEKIPVHEVDMKRKDLLPVFDRPHSLHSDWSGTRGYIREKYSDTSYSDGSKENFSEDAVICHAKLVSPRSVENSHAGSPRAPTVAENLEQIDTMKSYPPTIPSVSEDDRVKRTSYPPLNQRSLSGVDTSVSPEASANALSPPEESYAINYSSSLKSDSLYTGRTISREFPSSNSILAGEVSNVSSNCSDSSMNVLDERSVHEDMHDPLDFGHYFQEGYCEASTRDESHELTEASTRDESHELSEVVADVDSSNSPLDKEKSGEEGDTDDMLGGVFAFFEEG